METVRIEEIQAGSKGGMIPILRAIRDRKIPELIDQCLGKRVAQAKYSYSDCITSWMLMTFCSGCRMFRISKTKKDLSIIPGLNIPLHDTLSRQFKSLKTESEFIISINPKNPNEKPKNYTVNENPDLNNLLVASTKCIGLLKTTDTYAMDIDATLIKSGVRDARMTYKRFKGFTPMVCMIDKLPVYISMRSGNANPHFRKLDCIQRALDTLDKQNIKINRVRIDGAGYKREVLDYLHDKGLKFVVGANWSNYAKETMLKSKNWVKNRYITANHDWNAELASSVFKMKNSDREYRMVVIRIKEDNRKKGNTPSKTKWHLSNGYYYKFIITNDERNTPYEIFKEYDQRGTIEQNFDILKNDFGWNIVPFSNLNENLVYLIVTAMTNNMYQGLLKIFRKTVKCLDVGVRITNFKMIFIEAPVILIGGKYIYTGRSEIPHEKLG